MSEKSEGTAETGMESVRRIFAGVSTAGVTFAYSSASPAVHEDEGVKNGPTSAGSARVLTEDETESGLKNMVKKVRDSMARSSYGLGDLVGWNPRSEGTSDKRNHDGERDKDVIDAQDPYDDDALPMATPRSTWGRQDEPISEQQQQLEASKGGIPRDLDRVLTRSMSPLPLPPSHRDMERRDVETTYAGSRSASSAEILTRMLTRRAEGVSSDSTTQENINRAGIEDGKVDEKQRPKFVFEDPDTPKQPKPLPDSTAPETERNSMPPEYERPQFERTCTTIHNTPAGGQNDKARLFFRDGWKMPLAPQVLPQRLGSIGSAFADRSWRPSFSAGHGNHGQAKSQEQGHRDRGEGATSHPAVQSEDRSADEVQRLPKEEEGAFGGVDGKAKDIVLSARGEEKKHWSPAVQDPTPILTGRSLGEGSNVHPSRQIISVQAVRGRNIDLERLERKTQETSFHSSKESLTNKELAASDARIRPRASTHPGPKISSFKEDFEEVTREIARTNPIRRSFSGYDGGLDRGAGSLRVPSNSARYSIVSEKSDEGAMSAWEKALEEHAREDHRLSKTRLGSEAPSYAQRSLSTRLKASGRSMEDKLNTSLSPDAFDKQRSSSDNLQAQLGAYRLPPKERHVQHQRPLLESVYHRGSSHAPSWARYPSYNLRQRSPDSAGKEDKVFPRDFAIENLLQRSSDDSGKPLLYRSVPKRLILGERKGLERKSHSMTFGQGVKERLRGIYQAGSMEFDRRFAVESRGHRSSFSHGTSKPTLRIRDSRHSYSSSAQDSTGTPNAHCALDTLR